VVDVEILGAGSSNPYTLKTKNKKKQNKIGRLAHQKYLSSSLFLSYLLMKDEVYSQETDNQDLTYSVEVAV